MRLLEPPCHSKHGVCWYNRGPPAYKAVKISGVNQRTAINDNHGAHRCSNSNEDLRQRHEVQMLKARRNKNVLSFDLKVFRQLRDWISGERLFHTTGAHTLKERLAHTVLVLGTAIRERVDDLSDILDAVTRLEMRLFKYAGVSVSRTLNVRTASL